jgi:hypothetical protein
MGTPNLLSASLNSLTGSDNATGSLSVYFSERLVEAPSIVTSNYNFTPSLTIASASAALASEVWFKMDEGTGTSITSSNGLYSGSFQAGSTALSWESGSYSTGSYSLFFDQAGDYVTPPLSIWPTGSEDMVTVAFWSRMRGDVADDTDKTIGFYAANASNYRSYLVHFPMWDGLVYWDCGNSGGSSFDRLTFDWSSANRDNTQWHHWAFTKKVSTGQMRIYLDGVDVANSTGMTKTLGTPTKTSIGGNYPWSNYDWAGNLNDFAVWNTELSASDIVTLYNDGSGSNPSAISSSNLTVLYPFQEGAGSTCYDKSGNSRDGTITNSHWALADPTPQPRTFVKFPNDNNSYIDCGHHPNFGTGSSAGPFSVSTWVRWNEDAASNDAIMTANNGASSAYLATNGWGLYFYSNELVFQVQSNSNRARGACDANTSVKQWNHVVGTWDNSTIKIYINGVVGSTIDSYSGEMTFNNNPLFIGASTNTAYAFDATIDDARIYPGKALTQAEVTSLYNERSFSGGNDSAMVDLTVTGINTSQGYILDVNNNIVSSVGGNTCVPNSASFIAVSGRSMSNDSTLFKFAGDGQNRTRIISRKPGVISNLSAEAGRTITITTPGTLTVKYFQRVYDIDNTQWCYYTKTSIDATPGTSETTPTNSGNITSASIVQILEIY